MKAVHIIGVPLDLGGNRRGVEMGPSAFRIAGLGESSSGRDEPRGEYCDRGETPHSWTTESLLVLPPAILQPPSLNASR